MAVEQRFQTSFFEEQNDEPGLVLTEGGDVYLVRADGTRVALTGGGGGTGTFAEVLAAGGDPDGNPITGILTLQPVALGGTDPTDYEYALNLKPPADGPPFAGGTLFNAIQIADDDAFNDPYWGRTLADVNSYNGSNYLGGRFRVTFRRKSDGKVLGDAEMNSNGFYAEDHNPDTDEYLNYMGFDTGGWYGYGPGASTVGLYADYDGAVPIFRTTTTGGLAHVGFYDAAPVVQQVVPLTVPTVQNVIDATTRRKHGTEGSSRRTGSDRDRSHERPPLRMEDRRRRRQPGRVRRAPVP